MHVVGTAGHVDHGKSTLVHALTGIDPDRFEEEKRRGLTIDLGFAWCTLPSGREIGIVDVPGHERFIRNMLAGVGGIDAAIFVVAADEGWKPQSAEHLQILDFLDVRRGVVALTKRDLVDDDMAASTEHDVRQRLRGTCLHDARVVHVSGATGAGLDDLIGAVDAALPQDTHPDGDHPRLFIDRSFTIAGAGTVVTGTLTDGPLRVGDDVEVLPRGHHARIRTLQTHRRMVDEAQRGSRVAANLVGLERAEIARGDAIVRPGEWQVTNTFAARLRTAWDMHHQLTERGAYELFVGSAETACTIKFLEQPEDVVVPVALDGGALVPGVRADASLHVQIFARRSLPIQHGDRFVVRDVGRRTTVAGGIVLDPQPGTIRRGDAEAVRRLRAREGLTRTELAQRVVVERGLVRVGDLAAATGLSRNQIARLDGDVLHTPAYVLAAAFSIDLAERAAATLRAHHDAHPLDAGMARETLAAELGIERDAIPELVALWPDVVLDGSVVRLQTHGHALGPAERVAADEALAALRAGGVSPPGLRELGVPPALAKALTRTGELVVVAPDIAYPSDVFTDLRERIVALIRAQGPVTVSHVREAIGTSRKYAIPLLEHLDAAGVTRRSGNVRDVGPKA